MLTDKAIRAAKAAERQYKLSDEKGLFLLVTPAGGRLWRLKYRVNGKEKSLTLGAYPEVTLADARSARDAARQRIASGGDPAREKKLAKIQKVSSSELTFEAVSKRWFNDFSTDWAQGHKDRVWGSLERDAWPFIGGIPVVDIEPSDVLAAITRVKDRGAIETAQRLRAYIGRVMRYAVVHRWAKRDPAADTIGFAKKPKPKHFAATTEPLALGRLLVMIEGYEGSHPVRTALRLLPYLFCRPGELRQMHWEHLDLDRALWERPADFMKMDKAHIVPLSRQAVALFSDMPRRGGSPFVFPSQRGGGRPMSDMALSVALKSLGIDTKTTQTAHGFRATARTLLHEILDYPPEVIEVQLAHKPPGPLGAAYDRTVFLKQRTEMMQRWADYLDGLKKAVRSPQTSPE
jgi:integrase